ncbi:hypothetical protein HMPREF0671_06010 [Prevotella sp. S7 MS 2]|nr:hypothetical protein HMPREF0671_06010 [Prevotella sp. S7 MS 2]
MYYRKMKDSKFSLKRLMMAFVVVILSSCGGSEGVEPDVPTPPTPQPTVVERELTITVERDTLDAPTPTTKALSRTLLTEKADGIECLWVKTDKVLAYNITSSAVFSRALAVINLDGESTDTQGRKVALRGMGSCNEHDWIALSYPYPNGGSVMQADKVLNLSLEG